MKTKRRTIDAMDLMTDLELAQYGLRLLYVVYVVAILLFLAIIAGALRHGDGLVAAITVPLLLALFVVPYLARSHLDLRRTIAAELAASITL